MDDSRGSSYHLWLKSSTALPRALIRGLTTPKSADMVDRMPVAERTSATCIFCRIIGGEIPAKKVHEDEEIVAFEDVNPQSPTHILVVPRAHIPTLNDLRPEDGGLIARTVLAAREVAAQKGLADRGYRLVWNCLEEAGQSVFHIHLHLLGGRRMRWPPG